MQTMFSSVTHCAETGNAFYESSFDAVELTDRKLRVIHCFVSTFA